MSTQRSDNHHARYWRISVWIDTALEQPVREHARARGVSVNALITSLLTAELASAGRLQTAGGARPIEPVIVSDWMAAGVPIRAAKALARAGVTRAVAAKLSDADLRALPSVGAWAVEEARRVVPAPPSAIESFHDDAAAAATDAHGSGNGTGNGFDPHALAPPTAPRRRRPLPAAAAV